MFHFLKTWTQAYYCFTLIFERFSYDLIATLLRIRPNFSSVSVWRPDQLFLQQKSHRRIIRIEPWQIFDLMCSLLMWCGAAINCFGWWGGTECWPIFFFLLFGWKRKEKNKQKRNKCPPHHVIAPSPIVWFALLKVWPTDRGGLKNLLMTRRAQLSEKEQRTRHTTVFIVFSKTVQSCTVFGSLALCRSGFRPGAEPVPKQRILDSLVKLSGKRVRRPTRE